MKHPKASLLKGVCELIVGNKTSLTELPTPNVGSLAPFVAHCPEDRLVNEAFTNAFESLGRQHIAHGAPHERSRLPVAEKLRDW